MSFARSLDELQARAGAWRQFIEPMGDEARIYADPAFVYTELVAQSHRDEPCIAFVERSGELVCIAPCFVRTGSYSLKLSLISLGSLETRYLRVLGDEFLFADGADQAACVRALFAALSREVRFDLVLFEMVVIDGPTWKLLEELCATSRLRFATKSVQPEKARKLALTAEGWEDHLSTLSKSTRRKLLQTRKQLDKAVERTLELRVIREPEEVRPFLDAVDDIWSETWKKFALDASSKNTDDDVRKLEEYARRGWLRSYLLHTKEGDLAFVVGYQYGDTYYFEDMGYRQAWAKRGPGSVLTYMVVEDLFANDRPKLLDFGYGENAYKKRICNTEEDVHAVYLVPVNRYRAIVSATQGLDRVYRVVRSELERRGLDKRVRDLIKRKNAASANDRL